MIAVLIRNTGCIYLYPDNNIFNIPILQHLNWIKNHSKAFERPVMNIKELQIQTDELRKKLGSMMEENVGLKYRLAEVLKQQFDQLMLCLLYTSRCV